jgi:hypothetical protein
MRSASARRIYFGERGAKAVITGLVIAYGINSLATTLAASTFPLLCLLQSWSLWGGRPSEFGGYEWNMDFERKDTHMCYDEYHN